MKVLGKASSKLTFEGGLTGLIPKPNSYRSTKVILVREESTPPPGRDRVMLTRSVV